MHVGLKQLQSPCLSVLSGRTAGVLVCSSCKCLLKSRGELEIQEHLVRCPRKPVQDTSFSVLKHAACTAACSPCWLPSNFKERVVENRNRKEELAGSQELKLLKNFSIPANQ